jgi:hypothetical protein
LVDDWDQKLRCVRQNNANSLPKSTALVYVFLTAISNKLPGLPADGVHSGKWIWQAGLS